MTPWPSTTLPSTGQISCGSTTRVSPAEISSRGASLNPDAVFRCANRGIRWANASSAEETRRVAYCSNATPPESISTTIAPTRYSPSSAAVKMEIPASRSEPNSNASSLRARAASRGTPPRTKMPWSGRAATQRGASAGYLNAR